MGRRNGGWGGEIVDGEEKWWMGRRNGEWGGEMVDGEEKWHTVCKLVAECK